MPQPKNSSTLSAERVRALLIYLPETGAFYWRNRTGPVAAGTLAGTIAKVGYRILSVDRKFWYAHRLAWLYVYGQWPEHQIDHRNGNPLDNRIENLRDATQTENNANSRLRRKCTNRLKGITRSGRYWVAQISVAGQHKHLGSFRTAETAHAAYMSAAREHFGEFARAG